MSEQQAMKKVVSSAGGIETSITRYRSQFDKDGVVKIPQVFTAEEICNLRRAVFETLISTSDQRNYRDGGHIQWRVLNGRKWPAIVFWPALINEDLCTIRHQSGFVSIIRSFLGDNSRQMNNQVYLRLPGDSDEFNIHQDYMFRREIEDRELILTSYIQTIIAIDRVDATNGALEFYLGSHKAGLLDLIESDRSNLRKYDLAKRAMLEARFERKIVELAPGDMLIWNLLVVHGSRSNTSDRTRMTYMNGFCHSSASDVWPKFMENNELVKLDSAMIPIKAV